MKNIVIILICVSIIFSGCSLLNKEEKLKNNNECEEKLQGDFDYGYIILSRCIYWDKKLLKNIDKDSFEEISYSIAKDKNNVYRHGEILEEADTNSFVFMDNNCYIDKNNVYLYGKKMKNSDPDTFEVLSGEYFKDKNNVYFKETIIKNADPDTFVVDGRWMARDKNNKYYRDAIKIIEENVDDWKIYNNNEYGFEIKYPVEKWNFKEFDSFNMVFGLSRDVGYYEDDQNILIYVYEGDILNDQEYYLNKREIDKNEEKIIIHNHQIKKVVWGKDMIMLYLYRNDIDKTIVISDYFEEKDIIDLMLSTLKFK